MSDGYPKSWTDRVDTYVVKKDGKVFFTAEMLHGPTANHPCPLIVEREGKTWDPITPKEYETAPAWVKECMNHPFDLDMVEIVQSVPISDLDADDLAALAPWLGDASEKGEIHE